MTEHADAVRDAACCLSKWIIQFSLDTRIGLVCAIPILLEGYPRPFMLISLKLVNATMDKMLDPNAVQAVGALHLTNALQHELFAELKLPSWRIGETKDILPHIFELYSTKLPIYTNNTKCTKRGIVADARLVLLDDLLALAGECTYEFPVRCPSVVNASLKSNRVRFSNPCASKSVNLECHDVCKFAQCYTSKLLDVSAMRSLLFKLKKPSSMHRLLDASSSTSFIWHVTFGWNIIPVPNATTDTCFPIPHYINAFLYLHGDIGEIPLPVINIQEHTCLTLLQASDKDTWCSLLEACMDTPRAELWDDARAGLCYKNHWESCDAILAHSQSRHPFIVSFIEESAHRMPLCTPSQHAIANMLRVLRCHLHVLRLKEPDSEKYSFCAC